MRIRLTYAQLVDHYYRDLLLSLCFTQMLPHRMFHFAVHLQSTDEWHFKSTDQKPEIFLTVI